MGMVYRVGAVFRFIWLLGQGGIRGENRQEKIEDVFGGRKAV
jgi:hypothetical protein